VDRNHKSVCHQRKDAGEDHGSQLAAAIQHCITRKGWVRGPTLEGHRTRLMTWRMLKNMQIGLEPTQHGSTESVRNLQSSEQNGVVDCVEGRGHVQQHQHR